MEFREAVGTVHNKPWKAIVRDAEGTKRTLHSQFQHPGLLLNCLNRSLGSSVRPAVTNWRALENCFRSTKFANFVEEIANCILTVGPDDNFVVIPKFLNVPQVLLDSIATSCSFAGYNRSANSRRLSIASHQHRRRTIFLATLISKESVITVQLRHSHDRVGTTGEMRWRIRRPSNAMLTPRSVWCMPGRPMPAHHFFAGNGNIWGQTKLKIRELTTLVEHNSAVLVVVILMASSDLPSEILISITPHRAGWGRRSITRRLITCFTLHIDIISS